MKQSVKDAWIAALESGKYEQARGTWGGKSEDMKSYCCLQVLREEVLGIVGPETSDFRFEDEVLAHLDNEVIVQCYNMNDDDQLSFPEIAQKLREIL